jgi:putative membrane protein
MMFWWPLAIVFMILCMWMMARMMMGHGMMSRGMFGSRSEESEQSGPEAAERILADRLARGDIDVEEYERRRAALKPTSKSPQT